jgi:hypothetical protein
MKGSPLSALLLIAAGHLVDRVARPLMIAGLVLGLFLPQLTGHDGSGRQALTCRGKAQLSRARSS